MRPKPTWLHRRTILEKQVEHEPEHFHGAPDNFKRPVPARVRWHGRGGGDFRLAELLPAVFGAGRASQAAGQARAERPQVVCDRGNRAGVRDPDWLDKAIRIVEKQIQEMNKKQKGKEPEVSLAR